MRILGFEIRRVKSSLAMVPGGRSWWPTIRESFAGAWQQNVEIKNDRVMTNFAVWSCMTLIAGDIAKLRKRLVEKDENGIWTEVESPSFSPVIRRPNGFQTSIQFWENWMLSKLSTGNTYVLKRRDNRGVVVGLYILDPNRVQVLVSEDGRVFYQLSSDNITGVVDQVTVPASEIIHDRWNCLYHPLVGMSPIYACGLAATQGLNIQQDSALFFGNRSLPGGILTAPGAISNETATRLKEAWEANFGGENKGKVAVLGDDLRFEAMRVHATDAQVVEQLKWTAEMICSTFHVPPYKVGIGTMPANSNVQSLNIEYYSQALQVLMEAAEACMDEGLSLGEAGDTKRLGFEFLRDDLLQMDYKTMIEVATEGVKGGVFAPDEARKKFDLKPTPGGSSVYLQQQNYSLAALAKRDAKDDPFASGSSAAPPAANSDDVSRSLAHAIRSKSLKRFAAHG